MRLDPLPPPVDCGEIAARALPVPWPAPGRRARRAAQRLDLLAEPEPARQRLRRWFHPATGRVRRLERVFSLLLSRHVFPCIPGISRPYSRALLRDLCVSQAEIRLCGLGRSLDGLRLLLVTDVHAGPFLEPACLERAFRRLGALGPDVILLGGDLITCRVEELETHAAAFRSLEAPLGAFAVLGNHDHYANDPARLASAIESCGIRLLRNESVSLRRAGSHLVLAGVDDLLRGSPDLDRALEGARGPVVLLAHNPDLFFDAARRGVGLVLSGHTHAGQIRIPGLPVLVRQSRYGLDGGRYRAGGSELVVSRGLGAVGLPWRVACSPEAVLLTLRAA